MESRQGRARCSAQRLGCCQCLAAGDPGPEPDGSNVFTNHRGPQQLRGVAVASKGRRAESGAPWTVSLSARAAVLEPEIYSQAMGFPGCHCWRGNHAVKMGLLQ